MRKTIYFTIKRWHARLFFGDRCCRASRPCNEIELGKVFWMEDFFAHNLYGRNYVAYIYIGKRWFIREDNSYYNENNNE